VAHLLERGSLRQVDPERGRFRTFLLAAFKNYILDAARRQKALKRGGGQKLERLDADSGEERYRFEPLDLASPDVHYDRSWARAVLDQTLSRLRQEYVATRRGPNFDALKEYVWGERSGLSCAQLGREIGLSEEAAKKAVQRMRRRLAQTLREQIAETVSTPTELQQELRFLATLLA